MINSQYILPHDEENDAYIWIEYAEASGICDTVLWAERKSAVWVEAHGYKENSQSLTFAMCLLKENVNNILRVCGLVSSMHE